MPGGGGHIKRDSGTVHPYFVKKQSTRDNKSIFILNASSFLGEEVSVGGTFTQWLSITLKFFDTIANYRINSVS